MIIAWAREIKVAMTRSLAGQDWTYLGSYRWSYQGKAKGPTLRPEGAWEFAGRFIDSPDGPGLVYLDGSDF